MERPYSETVYCLTDFTPSLLGVSRDYFQKRTPQFQKVNCQAIISGFGWAAPSLALMIRGLNSVLQEVLDADRKTLL